MAMTFADIFNPAAPAPQQPQAQGTTPNAAAPANVDPFQKSTTPNPVPQQTAPLDTYKDLFIVDPNKVVDDPNAPVITYDKTQLNEAVGKMNFMEGDGMMELATKAAGGDTAALVALVNAAAQSGYSKAAELSANVANRAAVSTMERNQNKLPEVMRHNMAEAELAQLNPALSHPAIAPQAKQALTAMSQKFPTATSKELATHVNEYFKAAFQATTTPATPDPKVNTVQQDFSGFFGSGGRR